MKGILPIEELHIYKWKYLTENFPCNNWRDLNIKWSALNVHLQNKINGIFSAYIIFRQNSQGVIQAINDTLPMYHWCLLFCHNIWKNISRYPSCWSSPCWSWCLLVYLIAENSRCSSYISVIYLFVFTCMHEFRNGLISFFKLSRIIPYNFSTQAVRCCLNKSAGYLASIFDCVFGFPSIPLYPLEMPIPIGDVRNPC